MRTCLSLDGLVYCRLQNAVLLDMVEASGLKSLLDLGPPRLVHRTSAELAPTSNNAIAHDGYKRDGLGLAGFEADGRTSWNVEMAPVAVSSVERKASVDLKKWVVCGSSKISSPERARGRLSRVATYEIRPGRAREQVSSRYGRIHAT